MSQARHPLPHRSRHAAPRSRERFDSGLLAVLLTTLAGTAQPQPYLPASDDEILERLPPGPRSSELRRRREELATDPDNLRDSVAMAASYADTARLEGDPRYLGHAQAILRPWWDLASPPAQVLLVRAQVRALAFEFDAARVDLQAALQTEPDFAAAHALLLEVLLARGDVTAARHAWQPARHLFPPLAAALGDARAQRVSGAAPTAAQALRSALESPADADPADRHAALLLLADLALQLGRPDDAAQHFEAVRSLGRRDVRFLADYADHLLDRRQFAEVARLLAAETANDSLALRLLEAWRSLPDPDANDPAARRNLVTQVARRLETRRQRGDATALPDAVRFHLGVSPDPASALDRAQELWTVRRELRDARRMLEAAHAARQPAAARPVAEWLQTHGIVDARLTPLLDALRLAP